MRLGSAPSSRAIPRVWAERPGWWSITTILAFVTVGSFQRCGAFLRRRAVARRSRDPKDLYGGEPPREARLSASGSIRPFGNSPAGDRTGTPVQPTARWRPLRGASTQAKGWRRTAPLDRPAAPGKAQ